jgi:hypothetical protein
MPVGIAHHREVTDNATHINRRFNQNVLSTGEFGDAINLCTRVALKTKVIKTRFYFVLHDYQNESRIFIDSCGWPHPNVMPPLHSAVTHDCETAE